MKSGQKGSLAPLNCSICDQLASAVSFSKIYSFRGSSISDGAVPLAGQVLASDGNLYGTTFIGGANNLGTVFKISPTGTRPKIIHSFKGTAQGDGAGPWSTLVEHNGFLYGTTTYGGSTLGGACSSFGIFGLNADGCGSAFSVNLATGAVQTIATFPRVSGQPIFPSGGVTLGSDKKLYGVSNLSSFSEPPILYSLTPSGATTVTPKVLFVFSNDLIPVEAKIVEARTGVLFGTSAYSTTGANKGLIYSITTKGKNYKVLHTFIGGTDGDTPRTGLMKASNGKVYGTTLYGGSGPQGTIFKIEATGAGYKVLHSFTGAKGNIPYARLNQVGSLLYGTTMAGGSGPCPITNLFGINAAGCGTIYKMTLAGVVTPGIFSFKGTNGSYPAGTMVKQGTNVFGTTFAGGTLNLGTLFRFTP
ncbi:MAG: choice-of-anchor tandem repeat GloVer-containing protein [Thermosynechococcaceae cyanobacterium]